METKEINRTNDALFKWIFGNAKQKTILLEFINAVLTEGDEENIIPSLTLCKTKNSNIACKIRFFRHINKCVMFCR